MRKKLAIVSLILFPLLEIPVNCLNVTNQSNESSSSSEFLYYESSEETNDNDKEQDVKVLQDEEDENTLLDVFANVAVEILTKHDYLIPATDASCNWSWSIRRLGCEPSCMCHFQYKMGDYHLGRSCRLIHKVDDGTGELDNEDTVESTYKMCSKEEQAFMHTNVKKNHIKRAREHFCNYPVNTSEKFYFGDDADNRIWENAAIMRRRLKNRMTIVAKQMLACDDSFDSKETNENPEEEFTVRNNLSSLKRIEI